MSDEELRKNHGLSKIISTNKETKKGFNEVLYVKYISNSNFAGSFSDLGGEMFLLKKRNNIYIYLVILVVLMLATQKRHFKASSILLN